jgi:phosphoesterase RecJ-like protein
LAAAAHLAEIAPDYTSVISSIDNDNTPGVIAYEALALSSVTLHCNNKVAISAVSNSALVDKKINKSELFPDIGNMLKSVTGWEIGIKMVEDQPGNVKVSFRTRDPKKYDVSKIAVALGGGGHAAAAATYMKTSLPEAVKKVVEVIGSIYPELSK